MMQGLEEMRKGELQIEMLYCLEELKILKSVRS
jgi:hypothetical protein